MKKLAIVCCRDTQYYPIKNLQEKNDCGNNKRSQNKPMFESSRGFETRRFIKVLVSANASFI